MISEKKRLLLVEDELLIATVEMKALEKAGFSVITAATGEDAVETARNRDDIDLILMDINLGPGIDGAEAATIILKERDIPLVFLSSHTEPEVVDKTESITSYGYVVKNSGITVLTASIRMAFKLYDAKRQIEKQSRIVEDANRRLQELLQKLEETNRELVLSRSEILESRAALVESNEKFMRIADSMPQIVWTADSNGRIDFLNDIYYGYTGGDRYSGVNGLMNVHPEDVETSNAAWRTSVETGRIYEVRQRLRRHDGVYKWFLNRGIPVYSNDNSLVKWYGTCTDIDDLVILREERLRLEKNLLEAQRLSSTGSFEYDLRERRFYWSDEVFNIAGITRDGFEGRLSDFYRYVHPDDLAYVKSIVASSIDDRTCASFEYRIIRDDSTVRYLTIRFETIFDANENPVRIVGIVQDITGHSVVKKALRESEENYRALFEQAIDGIAITDLEGNYLDVNEAGCRMSGYSIDEFRKLNIRDLIALEEHFNSAVNIESLKSDGGVRSVRTIVRKDGSRFIAEISGKKLNDGRFQGIIRDITELKEAEAAARESEERWQFALESAGDGLWDWNTKTDEIFYSRRLKELLGYSDEEMKNTLQAWEALIHPDDHEYVAEEVSRLLSGEILFYVTEHRLRCSDGSYKWILDRGKTVCRDDNGKPLRIIGIFTDITQNRLIEENLATALAEKEALMRELQHRVKNTLGMITSLVSLELGQSDNPEVQKSLKTIGGRVMVLSNLYHMLYTGDGTSELPLDSYLKTIVGSITGGYSDTGRRIQVNTDFQSIDIDHKRATSIGIILNELLTNSIKYAFDGRECGTVNVMLRHEHGRIRLSVSDDGKGLPCGFDTAVSSGLGLKLIHLLASQMKGEFRINSEDSAVFEIALPYLN